MANTYTQIFLHIVFAVQRRQHFISHEWEVDLYKYISATLKNKGQKCLAINGMPDHIHILIGYKPTYLLPDLIREIKKSSTNWINTHKLKSNSFNWQAGYGAFSYHSSHLSRVIMYIKNQKRHHGKLDFKNEYVSLLNKHHVNFDEKYLFEF